MLMHAKYKKPCTTDVILCTSLVLNNIVCYSKAVWGITHATRKNKLGIRYHHCENKITMMLHICFFFSLFYNNLQSKYKRRVQGTQPCGSIKLKERTLI